MKHYITDVNKYDQDFKAMKNKINLTENEQREISYRIHSKMESKPSKKKSFFAWKPYLALAAAFLLIMVLSAPVLSDGINLFGKSKSAVATVEAFYEAYNNKDYEKYHSFASKRAEKQLEEARKSNSTPRSPEQRMRDWKRNWVPVEVMQIKDYGGTDKRTTVVVLLHYNSTLLSPEGTVKITYELVKEDGEWKIDRTVGHEGI